MPPAAARRRAHASHRPARRRTGAVRIAPKVALSGVGRPARSGPPVKLPPGPHDKDPKFQNALKKLNTSTTRARKHEPATKKAAQAQAAALPPANEKVAGARANQVDEMSKAETKKPESKSFRDMLRAEIKKVLPKKVEDGKDYMKGGDRQQLKGAMTANIDQQKGEAASGIDQAKDAPPDTSKVVGKEVSPMPNEPPPGPPPPVGAAQAMPDPKPEKEVSLQDGKKSSDQMMKDNDLDSKQMDEANDPRFSRVNSEKSKADEFADKEPQKYRAKEQNIINQAGAQAAADERRGLQGMQKNAAAAATAVKGNQLTAMQKDEARRKEVVEHIQSIFEKTKAAVDRKLDGLEKEAGDLFDRGADAAIEKMKDYVETRFDKRYDGVIGKGYWLKDKFLPLPDFIKAWFDQANQAFQNDLDALVDRVANLVELRIREAKTIIDQGQAEIRTYVQGLPKDLQAVGKAAEEEMNGRFNELREGVEDKKKDLAQKMAQKYKDASEKGAAALKELKDAHKSLLEKLRDFIREVAQVLRNFYNNMVSMLKKGADTIRMIVKAPVRFLKNLIGAIKKGLSQFVDKFWTHLKKGFIQWLFGSLGGAGIEIPSDFSIGSILRLVLQVLGLTYARIRPKIVKIIGERNMAVLEKAFELIKALWEGGPAALWEKIQEFLGDLKQTLFDAIKDWLITTIVQAAITKLVSMFNPVGAIIQAILMIYNTVMFFVENIRRILAFVEAVINSVHKIATGAIDEAANWIEDALARTIPIIIGFLARLLGLGSITDKIVSIIKKLQATVDKAVDKLIAKVVGGIGKLLGKGKKEEKPKSAEEAKWDNAVAMIHAEIEKLGPDGATSKDLDVLIPRWKQQFGFRELTVIAKEDEYEIDGVMSPGKKVDKVHRAGSKKNPFRLEWPKPASVDYPSLFFGGVTNRAKSQSALKGLVKRNQNDDTGTAIVEYKPNERKKLPGGETIGLTSQFRINVGSIVGPLSDATTPGGGKILRILERYGFRSTPEYRDGDHVREIQFGGEDAVENLWPLDASTNRGAGSILSKASVQYPTSGKTITISELKKKKNVKYYFRITKVT